MTLINQVSSMAGPVFVMTDLLLPTKGVDPPMLGHHPVLLRLRMHHTHQTRLLSQRVPSEQKIHVISTPDLLTALVLQYIHFCESILAVDRKLRLGMVEAP